MKKSLVKETSTGAIRVGIAIGILATALVAIL